MKTESKENLVPRDEESTGQAPEYRFDSTSDEYVLSEIEKKFLLAAEHGDCPTVKIIIDENIQNPKEFSIDCVDPLNRTALIAAIENENYDLIVLLLDNGIKVKDALLHAISEEYIEAVEELLVWEEEHHVAGQPYSWEAVDREKSCFTPDITPLILAAHRNNYEILKLLLDRGATLPMPHDVKCGCDDCVSSQELDSLRHSQARINAYRALTSSSLIALSSTDPLRTAFELSWELRRLQAMESEFRLEYTEMRQGVQEFSTSLLDYARTSHELEVMLNYDHEVVNDVWMPGDRQTLERLKLAIKYKQKMFVAHPNVQQLLAAIWYEGLPGFRRKTIVQQLIDVAKLGCMFPAYSMNYILAPNSEMGKLMRKPFVKFISHSASYAFFLMLLGAASQRIEKIALEFIGLPWMLEILEDWKKHERGCFPGPIECFIILYIISLIFAELRALYDSGLLEYINDLWNIVDFISNCFYVTWILCRTTAWVIVHRDAWYRGIDPYFPREHWHPFDPMLLSEGAFAAGMIFSFLKLVHIFSINPHLGPLQVSLGRMIIDIIKFFFIYTLVLFAFGCGLNQLLWYYADLEKHKCYHLHPDVADFDEAEKACTVWRRFANLFETSQSLFWASFGLVDLVSFDLAGIKGFTRFWALLMFGSYSVINIIVLLNMLIAMMSNSYQIISERADVEWKFARSQLWISYFEEGDTLPAPFNLCPTLKVIGKFGSGKKRTRSLLQQWLVVPLSNSANELYHLLSCRWLTPRLVGPLAGRGQVNQLCSLVIAQWRRNLEKAKVLHEKVMRLLVRRYVTAEQRKRDDFDITEDDIIEVRQDISSLRFELLDIFKQNNMNVPNIDKKNSAGTKKGRVMERRIMKDFQIGIVEGITEQAGNVDIFSTIANVVGRKNREKKNWNQLVRENTVSRDPIGSTKSSMIRRSQRSLRRKIIEDANAGLRIDTDKLVEFNPKLSEVTQSTRIAYVKFMTKAPTKRERLEGISEKMTAEEIAASTSKAVMKKSIRKVVKTDSQDTPTDPLKSSLKKSEGGDKKGAKDDKTPTKPEESKPSQSAEAKSKADSVTKPGAPQTKPPAPQPKPSGPATKSEPAKPQSPDAAKSGAQKPVAPGKHDKPEPATTAPAAPAAPPAKPAALQPKPAETKSNAVPTTSAAGEAGEGDKKEAGTAKDKKTEQKSSTTASKPDDKKTDDKKPTAGGAAVKPVGAAGPAKPEDKKPPPSKPSGGVGQSAAAAGGDRGRSTVTGRMISGWL